MKEDGLELLEGLFDLEGCWLGLWRLFLGVRLEFATVEVEDFTEVLLLELLFVCS